MGFLHVLVSFTLNSQLLTRALQVRIWPSSVNDGDKKKEALQWLGISTCTVLASWLVGNAIPFFSDLEGLISSICVGPTTFGFPALFYLLACRKNEKKVPWYEMITCIVMIFIAVFFVLVGTSVEVTRSSRTSTPLARPSLASLDPSPSDSDQIRSEPAFVSIICT